LLAVAANPMESMAFVKEITVRGTESNDANLTHADKVIAFPEENVIGFKATVPVCVVPGNCNDLVPYLKSLVVDIALFVAK
jgi:hypothetical protein